MSRSSIAKSSALGSACPSPGAEDTVWTDRLPEVGRSNHAHRVIGGNKNEGTRGTRKRLNVRASVSLRTLASPHVRLEERSIRSY